MLACISEKINDNKNKNLTEKRQVISRTQPLRVSARLIDATSYLVFIVAEKIEMNMTVAYAGFFNGGVSDVTS